MILCRYKIEKREESEEEEDDEDDDTFTSKKKDVPDDPMARKLDYHTWISLLIYFIICLKLQRHWVKLPVCW